MESQLLDDDNYTHLATAKSRILNINYLNTHNGIKVVPLDLVLSILKDIELRMEVVNTKLTSSGVYDVEECIEILDELYQDI